MQIRTIKSVLWLIVLACLVLGPGMSCQKADDGLNPQQQEKANRLETIVQTSGGDWDKVPAADRTYILTTFTSGDEKAARMLLLAKSGKMKAHPGAPPSGAPKP